MRKKTRSVLFLIRHPFIQLYSGFNTDDKGISRVMIHYVSNFVKSG